MLANPSPPLFDHRSMNPIEPEAPLFSIHDCNLADASLGAEVLTVSDEFFAPCARMLDPAPPRFESARYDQHGKWMDGWETRRRRDDGHDWCVIRLAYAGTITGLELDTRFFTGNAPSCAALDATFLPAGTEPDDRTVWRPLLDLVTLQSDTRFWAEPKTPQLCTHVRLRIYPDGGIARLRAYGIACLLEADETESRDLLALASGGRALAWSDAHYGLPHKLLRPGRAGNMGDGWETRRRRAPGHDWCILALGRPGLISRIDVDTAHFKGNHPASCSLQATFLKDAPATDIIVPQSLFWEVLLPEQPLSADTLHSFSALPAIGPISHIRFNIFPDGGVSRLRAYGIMAAHG